MAIPKIFKKNKPIEKASEIIDEKKQEKTKTSLKKELVAWSTLKNPYISEKATELAKENKYIFKIFDNANKTRVKEAIKEVYGADVVSVNIVKVPRKKKRLGRHQGWKKGFKKAIVEIKKGQKIDVYPS